MLEHSKIFSFLSKTRNVRKVFTVRFGICFTLLLSGCDSLNQPNGDFQLTGIECFAIGKMSKSIIDLTGNTTGQYVDPLIIRFFNQKYAHGPGEKLITKEASYPVKRRLNSSVIDQENTSLQAISIFHLDPKPGVHEVYQDELWTQYTKEQVRFYGLMGFSYHGKRNWKMADYGRSLVIEISSSHESRFPWEDSILENLLQLPEDLSETCLRKDSTVTLLFEKQL